MISLFSRQNKSEAMLNNKNIAFTIFTFAIPIILGNIFQQLYNIVDAIVVGKFLGDLPLSAISIASPEIDVFNCLIIGATIGVGVLVGKICGAKEWDQMKITHSTALIGGTAITIVLSILGLIFFKKILILQGNDMVVCDEAMKYLNIILVGFVFCFLYNYYAAIIRSSGDSQTPFFVLLISSTLHALLDLLFIGVFKWGIRGVAFSTVFCQAFSAIWMIIYSYKNCPYFRLEKKDFICSREKANTLLGYSWAAALQQSCVSIGRMLVQGMLTGLGTYVVTGYNMAIRNELFIFCFSQGISASIVVGLSQNYGAKNYERVRKFFRTGFFMEQIMSLFVIAICIIFPEQIISIFSSNLEVIETGSEVIRTMSVFYLFSLQGEVIQSFFRGIGRLKVTMAFSLIQICIRVVGSYYMVPMFGVKGICYATVIGWITLNTFEGIYSYRTSRRLGKTVF